MCVSGTMGARPLIHSTGHLFTGRVTLLEINEWARDLSDDGLTLIDRTAVTASGDRLCLCNNKRGLVNGCNERNGEYPEKLFMKPASLLWLNAYDMVDNQF